MVVRAELVGGGGATVALLGTVANGLLVDVTRVGGVVVVLGPRVAAATRASVAANAASVQLIAANANRNHLQLFNRSAQSLYVKYGTTATVADFDVVIPPDGYWEMSPNVVYTGIVHGIWGAADGSGFARVTEL
jgi:hypothetical protein